MLGKTEVPNIDNKRLIIPDEAGVDSSAVSDVARNTGIHYYDSIGALPVTGLSEGDQAFVASSGGGRLYISNGSGWYNAAAVNLSPTWDSSPLASYSIVDSATNLVVTALALDSDNGNLIWQGYASDSAQYLVDITRDSSIITFDPKSATDVYNSVTAGNLTDSDGGDFTYTFKWSDGINSVSQVSTISYTGLAPSDTPYRFRLYHTGGYVSFGNDALIMEFRRDQNDSDALVSLAEAMDSASDNSGSYTFTHQNYTKYGYLTFWDSAQGNGLTHSVRVQHNPQNPAFGAYTWNQSEGPRIGTLSGTGVGNVPIYGDSANAPSDTHYHHTDYVSTGNLANMSMTPGDWTFQGNSHNFNGSAIGGSYAQNGEDGHAGGTANLTAAALYFDTIRFYMEFDSSDVVSDGQTDNLIWTARAMGQW